MMRQFLFSFILLINASLCLAQNGESDSKESALKKLNQNVPDSTRQDI